MIFDKLKILIIKGLDIVFPCFIFLWIILTSIVLSIRECDDERIAHKRHIRYQIDSLKKLLK